MAYQYTTLKVADTDKITISMWFYVPFGDDVSLVPLLEFGPQPPIMSVNLDISGSLGLATCISGGNVSGPPAKYLQGTWSATPLYPANIDHFLPPGPYAQFATMSLNSHWGILNNGNPMAGFDLHGPDLSGITWMPDAGGGTRWSAGSLIYDSGFLIPTDIEVAAFSMVGGSKKPMQPSGFVLNEASPFFVATSRLGSGSTNPPNVIGIPGPNQKVLRPNGGIPFETWHHAFIKWDGTAAGWSIIIDGADSSDHSLDGNTQPGTWRYGTDKMALLNEHVGLPIIPDQDGPFSQNFISLGPYQTAFGTNKEVIYSLVQVWFNQSIDPGDFSHFYTTDDEGDIHPVDGGQSAADAFGTPDIWLVRDNISDIKFEDNQGTAGDFTVVGTDPKDVTPGPEDAD